MFETGNVVLHPSEGVCEIDDVRSERFDGSKKRTYYVMHPLYAKIKSTLFVPVDSDKIVLQKMPTKDEIIELIKSVSVETAGKKFSATDSKILKEAEKRVYQEFSYVLNTDEKNIPEFILKYLNV